MSSRPSATASRRTSATRSRSASEARSSGTVARRSWAAAYEIPQRRGRYRPALPRPRDDPLRHRSAPAYIIGDHGLDVRLPHRQVHQRILRRDPRRPAAPPTAAAGNASHCRGPSTFTTRAPAPPRSAAAPAPGRPPGSARSRPPRAARRAPPSYISRPWSMTITRVHSCSMSVRSWVVSSTVVPRSAFSSRRNSRTLALLTTSSPIVGSSRYSTSGSCSSAAAMSPRIRCPSDSCRTGTSNSVAEVEEFDAAVQVLAVPGVRDPVHPVHQPVRVDQRQVPPQGGALPEDHPDPARQPRPLPRRVDAGDPQPAAARGEDAGQHLDRGRLARRRSGRCSRPSRRAAPEADAVDRPHLAPLPAQQARLAAHVEDLLDAVELDEVQSVRRRPSSASTPSAPRAPVRPQPRPPRQPRQRAAQPTATSGGGEGHPAAAGPAGTGRPSTYSAGSQLTKASGTHERHPAHQVLARRPSAGTAAAWCRRT